jgi:hypothetical protein
MRLCGLVQPKEPWPKLEGTLDSLGLGLSVAKLVLEKTWSQGFSKTPSNITNASINVERLQFEHLLWRQ